MASQFTRDTSEIQNGPMVGRGGTGWGVWRQAGRSRLEVDYGPKEAPEDTTRECHQLGGLRGYARFEGVPYHQ